MRKGKVKNSCDTFELDGVKIIDRNLPFKPGTDSLYLARLADARKGEKVLEIGSGSGFISIYLSVKKGAECTGIELFERLTKLAEETAQLNGAHVKFLTGDARKIYTELPPSSFDLVVSNPPYIPKGEGKLPPSPEKQVARHEISLTIKDIARISKRLLSPNGRVWIAFPSERLEDAISAMNSVKLHLKRIYFITPENISNPDIFIACFTRKKGRVGVEVVLEGTH